jgi:hypothetical protein
MELLQSLEGDKKAVQAVQGTLKEAQFVEALAELALERVSALQAVLKTQGIPAQLAEMPAFADAFKLKDLRPEWLEDQELALYNILLARRAKYVVTLLLSGHLLGRGDCQCGSCTISECL